MKPHIQSMICSLFQEGLGFFFYIIKDLTKWQTRNVKIVYFYIIFDSPCGNFVPAPHNSDNFLIFSYCPCYLECSVTVW